MTNYIGKKVLVRGEDCGVFFGELVAKEGNEVELKNSRNIWYWSGANNLDDMAKNGIRNIENSKISVVTDSIVLMGICEIIPCSDKAIKCIEGAPEWKA